MKLDKAIFIVRESIEAQLTGNVTPEKDTEAKVVTFHWVKNDKTKFKESMSYRFSFEQLEQAYFPAELAQEFIRAWEKSKSFFKPEETVVIAAGPFTEVTTSVEVEEVVEDRLKKVSRKKKVVEDEGEVAAPPSEADEGS